MKGKPGRRKPGHVRKLRSGRYQASYIAPNGRRRTVRAENGQPLTFDTRQLAEEYLACILADIQSGHWECGSDPLWTIAPRTILPFRDNFHAATHDADGLRVSR